MSVDLPCSAPNLAEEHINNTELACPFNCRGASRKPTQFTLFFYVIVQRMADKWPVGQIWPAAWFCKAYELRMVFVFVNG